MKSSAMTPNARDERYTFGFNLKSSKNALTGQQNLPRFANCADLKDGVFLVFFLH
ncbi:hypothetical protein [Bacillus subtilis]|uniref:hypothetical protein n=1 Tax=Bacillus subtilis TaxID=1423 RepID=UPI00145B2414|nr:hypothetical protein [Bacillus subtilis]QNK37962.1 hypothetical protein H8S71_06355 [Bacillus subtilis subsp. subtilis]